jgi:hypothetical protein
MILYEKESNEACAEPENARAQELKELAEAALNALEDIENSLYDADIRKQIEVFFESLENTDGPKWIFQGIQSAIESCKEIIGNALEEELRKL